MSWNLLRAWPLATRMPLKPAFCRHKGTAAASFGQRTARQKRRTAVHRVKDARDEPLATNTVLATLTGRLARYAGGLRTLLPGDQYDPNELNSRATPGFQKRALPRRVDAFRAMAYDPLLEYKNVSLLSAFVSELGMIRPARETHVERATQRRLRRAIRRARAFGLLPYMYRLGPEELAAMRQPDPITKAR